MKRVFIVCCAILIALAGRAQTSSWTDATGVQFYFTIVDAANKYAHITHATAPTGATLLTVPGIVPYNGDTYTVTEVTGIVVGGYDDDMKKVILSENIKAVHNTVVGYAPNLEEIVFPSTLEIIGEHTFPTLVSLKYIDLSNTKVRFIGSDAFPNIDKVSYVKFPQTLRRIAQQIFDFPFSPTLKELVLPEKLDTIDFTAFSGLSLEEITFENPNPALLYYVDNPMPNSSTQGPLDAIFLSQLQTVYVPADATKAYQTTPRWSNRSNLYREKVSFGTTGYTTYYLENENFKVPTGCTAYIITGVTPSGSITTPDNAIVKAFSAGKIIPKQTGFILQGTPNSTAVYQANVTGIEEDVTGNLLVGTATEREINGAGYKYYVLSASGDQGLGFYKQGTRGGTSIKLKAHRAGLRLTESIARAKSFFIDFDAARENANVAGIRNIGQEAEGRDNIIYDLQGRRVKNPTHGIYIINGKKVIK